MFCSAFFFFLQISDVFHKREPFQIEKQNTTPQVINNILADFFLDANIDDKSLRKADKETERDREILRQSFEKEISRGKERRHLKETTHTDKRARAQNAKFGLFLANQKDKTNHTKTVTTITKNRTINTKWLQKDQFHTYAIYLA